MADSLRDRAVNAASLGGNLSSCSRNPDRAFVRVPKEQADEIQLFLANVSMRLPDLDEASQE